MSPNAMILPFSSTHHLVLNLSTGDASLHRFGYKSSMANQPTPTRKHFGRENIPNKLFKGHRP